MKKAKLNKDRCDNSPFCPARRVCPAGALEFKKKGFFSGSVEMNQDKCIGCGKCVAVCPHGALKL